MRIVVSIRDVLERHLIKDLGFIPPVSDYLENLEYQPWMSNENGAAKPSSQKSLNKIQLLINPDSKHDDSALEQKYFYDGSFLKNPTRPTETFD